MVDPSNPDEASSGLQNDLPDESDPTPTARDRDTQSVAEEGDGQDTTRIATPDNLAAASSKASSEETVSVERFLPSDDTMSAVKDLGIRLQAVPDQKILGRVAHYDIIRILGRGGMGSVFEAFDTKLFRRVAIKFMASSLAASEKSRSRFMREARVAASINHTNIVTIFAVEEYEGRPYLVMELVNGTTLHEHIKRNGALQTNDVLRIGRQIATGLRAAHDKAIVHRDVKPGNILLEDGIERVKIVDFGLAQVIFERSEITSQGQTLGTPRYMAPEQIEDNRVDERADLFSFGCVLYAMCAGRPPFVGNPISVLHLILRDQQEPVMQVNPDIPAALSNLIDRLLCKDRGARIQTAAEAETAIAEIIRAEDSSTSPWSPLSHEKTPRRTPWWAAVFVVLAGVFGWLSGIGSWFQSSDESPGKIESGVAPTLIADDAALEFQAPVRRHGPGMESVTVGAGGDFATLTSVAAYVQAGDTIVVSGPLPPNDMLALTDSERHRGVIVDWHPSCELVVDSVSAVIIESVQDVCIRGMRATATNAHLISLSGDCSGLLLEQCRLRQTAGSRQALIGVWASGRPDNPIVIRDCMIEYFDIACAVMGNDESASTDIRIEQNVFRGLQKKWGTCFVMDKHINHVHIIKNRIGPIGVGLSVTGRAMDLDLIQNTFFGVQECLSTNLLNGAEDFEVSCNLAVNCGFFAANDQVDGVHCELNYSDLKIGGADVLPQGNVEFESTRWDDENYLRPRSQLEITSKASGASPRWIGAVEPGNQ